VKAKKGGGGEWCILPYKRKIGVLKWNSRKIVGRAQKVERECKRRKRHRTQHLSSRSDPPSGEKKGEERESYSKKPPKPNPTTKTLFLLPLPSKRQDSKTPGWLGRGSKDPLRWQREAQRKAVERTERRAADELA